LNGRFLNGNALRLCGAGAFCALSFAVFIIAGAGAAATGPLDTTAFFEAAFSAVFALFFATFFAIFLALSLTVLRRAFAVAGGAACPLDANGAFVASSRPPAASCVGQGRHTSQKALSHAAQRVERRPSGGHSVPMAHSGGRMGTRTSLASPHVGHCIACASIFVRSARGFRQV
jgi:hypothetical protein